MQEVWHLGISQLQLVWSAQNNLRAPYTSDSQGTVEKSFNVIFLLNLICRFARRLVVLELVSDLKIDWYSVWESVEESFDVILLLVK